MKRLLLVSLLTVTIVSGVLAQSDGASADSFWLAIYETAGTAQNRVHIIEQMIEERDAGGPAVQPKTWDVLFADLVGRWNNLPVGNDRFIIEGALRLILAEIRQNGHSDRPRQVLMLARQARDPHLKAETILTLAAIRYGESSEFIAEELQRIVRAPRSDSIADEVLAHACIISLAQFPAEHAIAALSAAGADSVWLPKYLRQLAKESLRSLLTRSR